MRFSSSRPRRPVSRQPLQGYRAEPKKPAFSSSEGKQARRHRPDYWLLILTVAMLAIGLIVVYSIGPALSATRGEGSGAYFVGRQMIAIGLSAVAFFATSKIKLSTWRSWRWLLLGGALLATLIALLTPIEPAYPAHRWVRFGPLSLQSVEVVKFALIISISSFLAVRIKQGEVKNMKKTFLPIAVGLAILGMIVGGIQSDLGSLAVIVAMCVVMAYVAGMPMKKLLIIGLIGLIGVVILVSSTPYRRDRLAAYLNPESSCQTTGYQACQALIAIGSGGIFGFGVGKGAQAYGYLPEAQNDSIFAVYAEKFGFVGAVLLIGLYVTLFARLRLIAERAPDDFSRLVVLGILTWLSTQAIINIGAMVGLLPLKGITLPFVSYGGTSVLFVGAALGLAFQVSRYTSFGGRRIKPNREGANENRYDRRRIGRTHYADSGSRP